MYKNHNKVSEALCTSNAPLSRRLCKELDSMGLMGELASLLFKAQKANEQAKSYRGKAPVSRRPYGDYSKDRMQEMLKKASYLLDAHATTMGVSWGWSVDDKPNRPPWVFCIDLPTGQVVYRLPYRGIGPDYESGFGSEFSNDHRIAEFCAGVLDGRWMVMEEGIWE